MVETVPLLIEPPAPPAPPRPFRCEVCGTPIGTIERRQRQNVVINCNGDEIDGGRIRCHICDHLTPWVYRIRRRTGNLSKRG